MSTAKVNGEPAIEAPPARPRDMRLEVLSIAVSDVERAKRFYEQLGWRLDADFVVGDAFRGVQFTPPGSATSVHFGRGRTADGKAEPPSPPFLVVPDLVAAREDLVSRGIAVTEIFHRLPGQPPASGPHPDRRSYASYAIFSDPDGNRWLLQEVSVRLPGRMNPDATFATCSALAGALRRASRAHGEHEQRVGKHDTEGWPDWYARYMFAEQSGEPLPT